jgi:subfamily B ATP-binding cassette protein MsbA
MPLITRLVRDHGLSHWRGYGLAFGFMALMTWTTAMSAWLMKDVINEVFISKNERAIWMLAGTVIGIYVLKGFATYGQQVTLSRIANDIVARVQKQMFNQMLAMDVRFYAERHSSDFIARQSFIAQSAGQSLNLVITSLGRDLLSVIGLTAVMVLQDPMMSVVGVVVMPAAIFGVRSLVRRARKVMHTEFAGSMIIMETVQETAVGVRTVKSFTLEEHLRRKMYAAIEGVQRAANKLAVVGSRSGPVMESLGGFAVAGVILYGGYRVVGGGQTPGAFFSFITALLMAYEPAKRLARVNIELSASLVGVKMLFEFCDLPAKEAESMPMPDLRVSAGEVVFDKVTFAYRPDEPVLRDLNLVARAGQVTALVGHSGGGKSTIISLLQRLYEVDGGRITIDGTSIADVSRHSLRSQIAVVSQDPFLFKGTIFDNIALGRPDATEAEVMEAARVAYAHDFIMGFQNGYRSQVGEQGHQLSGGQRQRIAIARAVLKNAPILLLDEATAALDTESEREIQLALQRLMVGRTTIVIAHRLQTIQNADRICVIEGGGVQEQGTHQELLESLTRYAQLHAVYHAGQKPIGSTRPEAAA